MSALNKLRSALVAARAASEATPLAQQSAAESARLSRAARMGPLEQLRRSSDIKADLSEDQKVDLSRRFFFTMVRPSDNLPAVIPDSAPAFKAAEKPAPAGGLASLNKPARADIARNSNPPVVGGLSQLAENLSQTPASRRTVLRGVLAQALKKFTPDVSIVDLAREAVSEPGLSQYALSPELKAAVYNMPYRSWQVNWGDELIDRGRVAEKLLRYGNQDLIGNGGLTLKQALRQMQSDPKVYSKFKQTLNDLGNEMRSNVAGSREQYLDYVKSDMPEKYAREARLWDQTMPGYKPDRLPSEDAPWPMYDPEHSRFMSSFEEMKEIYPEFQDTLKGLTNKQARQAWADYSKSEEGQLAKSVLKKYKEGEIKLLENALVGAGVADKPWSWFSPAEKLHFYRSKLAEAGKPAPQVYIPGEKDPVMKLINAPASPAEP